MNKLELENVSKNFGGIHAIKNISMTVQPRELVSIIGPSGCGKSTLLNMISGLFEPDDGLIYLNGKVAKKRKGHVSYMIQKDLLLPWLKIIDNVILSQKIKGESATLAKEKARPLFKVFGLEGFEDKYPSQLSGGMRQRAALMRTYLDGKEILLLDEPFSGLDALTKMKMQDWLLNIKKTLDLTIVFVTHDIDEAIYLSNRIFVMSKRPATIKAVKYVELRRPRQREMMESVKFLELKRYLVDLFEKEV